MTICFPHSRCREETSKTNRRPDVPSIFAAEPGFRHVGVKLPISLPLRHVRSLLGQPGSVSRQLESWALVLSVSVSRNGARSGHREFRFTDSDAQIVTWLKPLQNHLNLTSSLLASSPLFLHVHDRICDQQRIATSICACNFRAPPFHCFFSPFPALLRRQAIATFVCLPRLPVPVSQTYPLPIV